MPDGPVVALAVLVAGLAILAIGFVIARVRNPDRGRHHARTAPRLPLFGTDLLLVRTVDDELVAPDAVHGGETSARPGDVVDRDSDRGAERAAAASFAPPTSPRAAPADGTAPPLTVATDGGAVRPRSTPPRSGPSRDVRPPMRPAGERPGAPRSPIEFRTTSGDNQARPSDIAAALAASGGGVGSGGSTAARAERPGPAPAALAELRGAPASAAPAVLPEPEEYVEGQTLRFAIPTDGTLQFLPGRLEVIAGADTGREIRFVRLPGEPAVEVTFGRTSGPPYSHVQLHARTVSRRHAVMSLLDDHWQLQNLSTTNPVVLNGRSLAPDEIAPLLVEGDRIEMGEIVFVFHGR